MMPTQKLMSYTYWKIIFIKENIQTNNNSNNKRLNK